MADENITLERDYVDSFSIKDFVINDAMPAFFPGESPTNLTTGTIGLLSECVSTITEDAFNTGSSLLSEVFPTRSKMETSIYSNAAIFQITNAFADGATCDFLLLLAEEDVRKNLQQRAGTEYGYFYLDKDTVVRVGEGEGIPFSLDYDIEIRAIYRESKKRWIYSAKYVVEEFTNSISSITDPYIRLQQYPNGMLVLHVTLRQYLRTVIPETILDNATLNYPTINLTYTGKLLGFDVLYKNPGEEKFTTQLEHRVIYSTPVKTPFCYYRMIREGLVELSFTTKDAYFQPKFNSELEIYVYTTEGKGGDFEYYDGERFTITKGDKYQYNNSWLIAARSISGSSGGKEKLDMEGLRDLTVEGFTTANSLNTENDLQVYFNNYKHRHDNEVLFIKKRNDAVELLFSAFMFIKMDDYIYPTNTLYLDTNIQYLDYKDGGFYNLDPGYLFGYKSNDVYRIPVWFMVTDGDGEKYDPDGHYYGADGNRDATKDITKRELQKKVNAGYVTETDHAYWLLVPDESAYYYLYHADGSLYTDIQPITEEELFTKFHDGELTYDTIDAGENSVDFLFDFDVEAAARKEYLEYFDTYKEEIENEDLTFEEYLFDYTFKRFKKDRGIDSRRTIFNTDVESFSKTKDFLFVNPFITTVAKDTGLVSYYQSYVTNNRFLDYVNENSGATYSQFVTYTLHVDRDLSVEKMYRIKINVIPTVPIDDMDYVETIYDATNPDLFIEPLEGDLVPSLSNFKMEKLHKNILRMVLMFNYKDMDVGYLELIPTGIDKVGGQIAFEGVIHTDDFISADNNLRITHICPYCGHEILDSANAAIENLDYFCDNCKHTFKEGIVNIREMDTLSVPICDAVVRLVSLFNDPEKKEVITDNEFVQWDPSFTDYVWTNNYKTINDKVNFIEPLEMMRSSIIYKDYYVTGVDKLDCEISDLPLLKYSIMAYNNGGPKVEDPLLVDDIGKFKYFMDAFNSNYGVLRDAKIRLNGMHIDTKFYNSYGRSTNFDIGEDGRRIDTNNIRVYFDIWVLAGIDLLAADKELRTFIKGYIETINTEGSNNLYISNLIREIENNFAYVHHIRFNGINSYDSSYQAIINRKISLEDMTKVERRKFVPDILVINRNNIFLSFYQDEF